MPSRRLRIGTCAGSLLAALSFGAEAQTINYKEVEDLFGEPVTTSATGSPLRRSEAPGAPVHEPAPQGTPAPFRRSSSG